MSSFLVRPTGGLFIENEDGSFSLEESEMAIAYKYGRGHLLELGFIEFTDEQLARDKSEELEDSYRDFINSRLNDD
jgi:hypothetical protein